MIAARDAIETARSMIGTPYSEMDCMALIVQVIRRSPGGVKSYRCQGTNWLWDSAKGSGKYRHLTNRQEELAGAKAGMLAFKRYGMEDEGHVGLVTEAGTVIHASSERGRTVETVLSASQGWDLLGVHRYIETEEMRMNVIYRARVATKEDPLSLRDAPERGNVIARMPIGAMVDVMREGDWALILYEGVQGYAAGRYLERIDEQEQEKQLVLTDEAGNTWIPEGGFSLQMRRTED
ncbi:MAG: C40 family peptidase [Clostridia bacterium]|nr:C40 family peptidase [Clostridia bacterium]